MKVKVLGDADPKSGNNIGLGWYHCVIIVANSCNYHTCHSPKKISWVGTLGLAENNPNIAPL